MVYLRHEKKKDFDLQKALSSLVELGRVDLPRVLTFIKVWWGERVDKNIELQDAFTNILKSTLKNFLEKPMWRGVFSEMV